MKMWLNLIFISLTSLGANQVSESDGNLFLDLKNPKFSDLSMTQKVVSHGIKVYEWRYPDLRTPDKNLGNILTPNIKTRHISRTSGQILYDVTYTIDGDGVRATPQSSKKNKSSISLLGCSLTFGLGLKDSETISSFLSEEISDASIFNRGHPGVGTNFLVAQAEEDFFKVEKTFAESTFVYMMYEPSHTNRNSGKLPALEWSRARPYYFLKDGQLVREGSFLSGRPIQTWIYLNMAPLLRLLGMGYLPSAPPLTEGDFELTCELVAHLRDQIKKFHPKAKFFVYLLPFDDSETSFNCLAKKSIPYLSSALEVTSDFHIPIDNHPSKMANRLMANEISEYLKSQKHW